MDSLFPKDPFKLFQTWFDDAKKTQIPESNAMTLSTVTDTGSPTSRIVYLKGLTEHSFQFYTNYHSRKGHELLGNPHACLQFFWVGLGGGLGKQVRIEGKVEKLSAEESDAYFATRDRDSQIGAWASQQSEPLDSREALEHAFHEAKARFNGQAVSRPPHWGGYALKPHYFEFWIGRESRLHDRSRYTLDKDKWVQQRLFP